jgi:citrate lyase beta subunit
MGYYETYTQKEMKAILLTVIFLLIFRAVLAPEARMLWAEAAKKIDPYKRIMNAISFVESRHQDSVINWHELAYGRYQIRQVRLDDYYQRTGMRYELIDMLDSAKAAKVARYYAVMEGWRNPERVARCWNGGVENGMRYRQTLKYWNLVKVNL